MLYPLSCIRISIPSSFQDAVKFTLKRTYISYQYITCTRRPFEPLATVVSYRVRPLVCATSVVTLSRDITEDKPHYILRMIHLKCVFVCICKIVMCIWWYLTVTDDTDSAGLINIHSPPPPVGRKCSQTNNLLAELCMVVLCFTEVRNDIFSYFQHSNLWLRKMIWSTIINKITTE